MAEEQNNQPNESAPKTKDGKKSSLIIWIVMLLVVIVSAGAGIGIGQLFGGTDSTEETQPQEPEKVDPLKEITATDADGKPVKNTTGKNWYFELEPVIANLNEPGATRYVMVTLIIEVNPDVDEVKGTAFLKEKSYPIKDWLTIYFAGLTLEDIQGDKNLKRVQNYICEMLNEKLFPNAKPQIQHILFKEFAIQ